VERMKAENADPHDLKQAVSTFEAACKSARLNPLFLPVRVFIMHVSIACALRLRPLFRQCVSAEHGGSRRQPHGTSKGRQGTAKAVGMPCKQQACATHVHHIEPASSGLPGQRTTDLRAGDIHSAVAAGQQ
jgi:hypothetical protein